MFITAGQRDFMEAGKKRLSGDVVREATSDEVKALRSETAVLKDTLDEIMDNDNSALLKLGWDPECNLFNGIHNMVANMKNKLL